MKKAQNNKRYAMNNRKYHISGFTIVELMITLIIASVLLTVGVPSFAEIIKQNKITSETNTVISALNYARNETITQDNDVTLQPITTSSTDWTAGWQVIVDGNTLRFYEAVDDVSLTLSHPDGDTTIVYKSDGSIESTAAVTLTLTPDDCESGEDDIRQITISLPGHVSLSRVNCT